MGCAVIPLDPIGQPLVVTFANFAALMDSRGHDIDELVERFRGRIHEPRDFFTRVFLPRFADVVIPYNSVLVFYQQEAHFRRDLKPTAARCKCGCGQPVFGRRKWAGSRRRR